MPVRRFRRIKAEMEVDFGLVKVKLFNLENGKRYYFLMDEEEFERLQRMKGEVIPEITFKDE